MKIRTSAALLAAKRPGCILSPADYKISSPQAEIPDEYASRQSERLERQGESYSPEDRPDRFTGRLYFKKQNSQSPEIKSSSRFSRATAP